jgi:hypothetical protein
MPEMCLKSSKLALDNPDRILFGQSQLCAGITHIPSDTDHNDPGLHFVPNKLPLCNIGFVCLSL